VFEDCLFDEGASVTVEGAGSVKMYGLTVIDPEEEGW